MKLAQSEVKYGEKYVTEHRGVVTVVESIHGGYPVFELEGGLKLPMEFVPISHKLVSPTKIRRLGPSGGIYTKGKVYDVVGDGVEGSLAFYNDQGEKDYAKVGSGRWEEVVEVVAEEETLELPEDVEPRIADLSRAVRDLSASYEVMPPSARASTATAIKDINDLISAYAKGARG